MATSSGSADRTMLQRLYVDERLTIATIAVRMGVAPATIHSWLVADGIPRRPSPATRRGDVRDNDVRRLYLDHQWSATKIANYFGCGPSTIYKRLADMGVARHEAGPRRRIRPHTDHLRCLYLDEQLSLRAIARRYHVTATTVWRWLQRADIPRRPSGGPAPVIDDNLIVQQYQQGATGPELAARHGCSSATIYRRLDALGVPRRQDHTAVDRETLRLALAAGKSATAIADECNASVSAVTRALTRHGLNTTSQAARRRAGDRYAELLAGATRSGTSDEATLAWLRQRTSNR